MVQTHSCSDLYNQICRLADYGELKLVGYEDMGQSLAVHSEMSFVVNYYKYRYPASPQLEVRGPGIQKHLVLVRDYHCLVRKCPELKSNWEWNHCLIHPRTNECEN